MMIRRERPDDEANVRKVQIAAFRVDADNEPLEARLLDALRRDDAWLPRFSIVAELEGTVIGHCVCTRGFVGEWPALGLGPIAVHPDGQRDGVGLALMHATIGAAEATDEPLIALLGSPDYYGRFGFVASHVHAIAPPEPAWGDYFQVLPLTAYWPAINGPFAYASPFRDVT